MFDSIVDLQTSIPKILSIVDFEVYKHHLGTASSCLTTLVLRVLVPLWCLFRMELPAPILVMALGLAAITIFHIAYSSRFATVATVATSFLLWTIFSLVYESSLAVSTDALECSSTFSAIKLHFLSSIVITLVQLSIRLHQTLDLCDIVT